MNEKINNEITQENENRNISYEDLLMVSSGQLESGESSSIATIVVDRIDSAGEQVADMEIILQNAILNFFSSGGCLVLQADFSPTGAFEFRRAIEILSKYTQNSLNEEYRKTHCFGVVAVPMLLQGQVSISMQDLVYFTGFDLPNLEKRLILCFNDLETEVIDTSGDVDFEEIQARVQAQIQREQDSLQAEIDAVNAELQKEEEMNPYSEALKERYQQNIDIGLDFEKEQEETEENKWMRKSKE